MQEETVCQAYYWISVFQLLTLVHNTRVLFASHCLLSYSRIVQWFAIGDTAVY